MTNCLFEATLQKIEFDCGCTPKNFIEVVSGYKACTGEQKECMNNLMEQIGDVKSIDDDGEQKECLAVCQDQKHSILVTQAGYPNRQSFSQRLEYCVLIRKLIHSCLDARRFSLNIRHPDLCNTINETTRFNLTFNCQKVQIVQDPADKNHQLVKLHTLVYEYARENVAKVNIFVREPYVAKYKTEEKITEISFVGTVGGLFGLFMGFSFVSLVEMVYLCCFFEKKCQLNNVKPFHVSK